MTTSREYCVTSSAAQMSFHQARSLHGLFVNATARPFWSSECAACDHSSRARESDSESSGESDDVGIGLALFAAVKLASSPRRRDSASTRIEDTRSLTAGLTPDVMMFEDPATSQSRIVSSLLWSHPLWKLRASSAGDWSCVTAASAIGRSMTLTSVVSGAAVLRPGREIALRTRPVM